MKLDLLQKVVGHALLGVFWIPVTGVLMVGNILCVRYGAIHMTWVRLRETHKTCGLFVTDY